MIDGGTWKHYKGGLYRVICRGRHADTGEVLICYEDIGTGRIYFRPETQWLEAVAVAGSLHTQPRFRRVSETPAPDIYKAMAGEAFNCGGDPIGASLKPTGCTDATLPLDRVRVTGKSPLLAARFGGEPQTETCPSCMRQFTPGAPCEHCSYEEPPAPAAPAAPVLSPYGVHYVGCRHCASLKPIGTLCPYCGA